MANQVAHFSINADNLSRARSFYENVFRWKFNAWGPPGFYMIDTGELAPPAKGSSVPLRGLLQQRREIVPGVPMRGFECTISVDDVDAAVAAVEANGGIIVMKKCTLVGVGQLFFFQDPEGNIAGAMQYDEHAE